MSSNNLLILVATMTGTALMAAEDIAEYCENNEINTKVHEMDNLDISEIINANCPILICSSTYGQGDVPDGSQDFYDELKKTAPNLSNIKYSIFGLGDMTYRDTFAYGGKKFFDLLNSLGANSLAEPFYHDASDGTLPEEIAVDWFKDNIMPIIKS